MQEQSATPKPESAMQTKEESARPSNYTNSHQGASAARHDNSIEVHSSTPADRDPQPRTSTEDRPSQTHDSVSITVTRGDGANDFSLTDHAQSRMYQRSINRQSVATVLNYGRCIHARGAVIYAIGRKEVAHYETFGIDLREHAGYQVICSTDGTILTAYRNHNLSAIRKTRGRRSGYNRGRSVAVAIGPSC